MDTGFIYRLFEDVEFPTETEAVLLHAKIKGVGGDLHDLLLKLPVSTFDSCEDIIRELPLEEFEQRTYEYL
jgi:hypothetical protein